MDGDRVSWEPGGNRVLEIAQPADRPKAGVLKGGRKGGKEPGKARGGKAGADSPVISSAVHIAKPIEVLCTWGKADGDITQVWEAGIN